jgi:hypothetical protein
LLLMGHHEGHTLKYQGKQERLRVLPLNPMESGKTRFGTDAVIYPTSQ